MPAQSGRASDADAFVQPTPTPKSNKAAAPKSDGESASASPKSVLNSRRAPTKEAQPSPTAGAAAAAKGKAPAADATSPSGRAGSVAKPSKGPAAAAAADASPRSTTSRVAAAAASKQQSLAAAAAAKQQQQSAAAEAAPPPDDAAKKFVNVGGENVDLSQTRLPYGQTEEELLHLATMKTTTVRMLGWLGITEHSDRPTIKRAKALHVAWDTMQLWIAVCWEYLLVVMEAQHSLHILSGNTPPWGTDAYWRALKGGLPNAAPKPAAIAEEPEPLAPDAEVDAPLLPPPLARYRSPRPMPPSSPRLPARNAQSPRRKTRLLMRSIELDPKGAMGSRAPTLAFAEEATGGREARFLRPPSVQPRRAAGQRRRAMLEGDVPNTDQRMHSKLMSLLETARERPQVRSTLPPVMPQPKGVLRSKVSSLQMQTRDIETGGDMLYDSDIVGLPPFHTPDILATLSPERPCHHPPPVANPFANLNKSTFGTFGPPLAAAGGRSSAGGSRSTSVQRASSVPRSSGSSAAPAASGGATATSKPAGSASSARRSGGAATADGPAAARDVTPQSRKSRARLNSEGGDRRSPLPAAAEEDGIGGGDDGVEGQQQAEEGGGESTSFARTSGGSRRRTTGSKPGATSGGGGVKLMYHDGVNKVEGAAPAEDGLGATVADGRPVGAAGKVFFDPFGEGPYLDIDNLVPEGHFRTHIRVKACH